MADTDDRRSRIANAWEAAWDRGDLEPLDDLLEPGLPPHQQQPHL